VVFAEAAHEFTFKVKLSTILHSSPACQAGEAKTNPLLANSLMLARRQLNAQQAQTAHEL